MTENKPKVSVKIQCSLLCVNNRQVPCQRTAVFVVLRY